MAIGTPVTVLGPTNDLSSLTTKDTIPFNVVAGRTYIAFVAGHRGDATVRQFTIAQTHTGSWSWTAYHNQNIGGAVDAQLISVFVATAPASSSGFLTFALNPSAAYVYWHWAVVELTGAKATALQAVPFDINAATTASATLAAYQADSLGIGFTYDMNDAALHSPGAGWAELFDGGTGAGTQTGSHCQWDLTPSTTYNLSCTANMQGVGIALEIEALAGISTPATVLGPTNDIASLTTKTTATFGVVAGRTYIVAVAGHRGDDIVRQFTISAQTHTGSWVWTAYHNQNLGAGGNQLCSVFVAVAPATTASGTITFSIAPSAAYVYWHWAVVELTGAVATARQAVSFDINAATTASATLAAYLAGSLGIGFAYDLNDAALHSPGSGWQELFDGGTGTGAATGFHSQWDLTPSTTYDLSCTANMQGAGIALEIAAAGAVAAYSIKLGTVSITKVYVGSGA